MDRRPKTLNRLGQTALEYLLIIVVAMSVIVTIMVWMQASSNQLTNTTSGQVDVVLCALEDCSGPSDPVCQLSPCPPTGTCGPAGKCQV